MDKFRKENLTEFCIKFLTSPIKLTFLLIALVLFITFIIYSPIYRTSDDAIMRAVAEGTLNSDIGPSNILFYSSSYYGEILKKLYLKFGNFYWYDLLCYLFQTLALFVTSVLIFDKSKDKMKYNIFAFLTIFSIYTPLFLAIQFTTYSGMVTISAISACIYLLRNKLSKFAYFVLGSYAFFAVILAGLIRFEACCIVLVFGSAISLFLASKKDTKKLSAIIAILAVALGINFAIKGINNLDIKKSYNINQSVELNKQLVKLYNDTIAGNNQLYPWLPIESEVKNLDDKLAKVGWMRGDYRLLLTWNNFGDRDIFELSKMKKLSKILSEDILITNNFNFAFKIQDFWNVFGIYVSIFLFTILLFCANKKITKPILIFASFFALEILLNLKFRNTPYRLWVNFIMMALIVLYNYIKYNQNGFITDYLNKINLEKGKNIIAFALILTFSCISIGLVNRQHNFNRRIINGYNFFLKNYERLDNKKIYVVNVLALEIGSLPFSKNIYSTNIKALFSGFNEFPQQKTLLAKYKIPKTKTWDYICSTNKVELLTVQNGPYQDFYFVQLRLAATKHMNDRYNKHVVFVQKQEKENLKTYSCETMSKKDLEFVSRLRKAQEYNGIYYLEKRVNNLGKKYL